MKIARMFLFVAFMAVGTANAAVDTIEAAPAPTASCMGNGMMPPPMAMMMSMMDKMKNMMSGGGCGGGCGGASGTCPVRQPK